MSDPYPSGSSPKGEVGCAAMSFAGNAEWSMVNSQWSEFIGCPRRASCRRFRYFTIHHVTLAFIAPVAFLNSRPPAIPVIQHSPLTISHFNALSCRFRPAGFFPLRQSFPSAALRSPARSLSVRWMSMKADYAITLYLLRPNRQAIRTTCRTASRR
jgi:hypothetical protein